MGRMSDDLRISLLGPLTVSHKGVVLPANIWRSRQERRLLAILLTMRGARVPAERLIEWLWPDADPISAATTLRSAVSGLRHTLEPERAERASSHYILTRQGGYAWNMASGAWVDADAFLALTAERETRADPDTIAQLEQALALYQGDYLADEPDTPWADRLRELLHERFIGLLHDLAELRLEGGLHEAAIALARRGLDQDQLREPLYRTLMRAQARAGDVASALQTYERCRHLLNEELGASPSAQTRALHSAILRGEESREAIRKEDKQTKRPGEAPSSLSPNLPVSWSPFVGRAKELAALRDWMIALDQQRGGVVAVVGEAGIGKTRLIAEALRGASRDAFTIALRCTLLERGLPFAPLSEALRPVLRAVPLETLQRLPSVALAQVADLLPVLRERLPDLPRLPSPPPGEGRNYLLDGIVDVALALSREHPLIIWCDDAQWADDATLAALGRLSRHAPRYAMLLVLAYRSEELVENAALHQLLRTLGREMSLRPLVLGRLDAAEVTQFLAVLAQAPLDRVSQLAPRLHGSSGGNPLFLSVAVQSLLESSGAQSLGALLPALEAGAPLPDLASAPPLRDLVLARTERLPNEARSLLEQLAVIGRPASLDLIEELAGAPGLEAAQTLLARQFLVEGADGRLGFGHELVRSIIVSASSSPQRRLLHRRAAAAIAVLHGEKRERAAELAFHFEQAGRGVEAETLRFAIAAGEHARRAFGYREALGHYDTALRAAERLGDRAPAEAVRRAFVGRLLMTETLLDWDGILDTAARYDRWAAQQPAALPLVAPRRLAVLRALMGDLAGAAALSSDPARRPPNAPAALDDLLRRTAAILRPADPRLETEDWSFALAQSSIAAHRSPIAFIQAPPLPGAPAEDLPALLGNDEAALPLFQVGWTTLIQGRLHDAEPCLVRAYDLAIETSQAAVAVISALQLAHLNALRGDSAASERWMRTSLDTAQQAPEAAWASIWPHIHHTFLLLLDDRYAAAREQFEQIAAQLRGLPAFQSHRASVEVGLALLDLTNGDRVRAATRLRQVLAAPQLLYGFVYVAALHGLARIAAVQGDLPATRATLMHALVYSARRSMLAEYIRTAIEIARIERDFGDPAPTLALLGQAAALASSADLAPLANVANALLRRLEG